MTKQPWLELIKLSKTSRSNYPNLWKHLRLKHSTTERLLSLKNYFHCIFRTFHTFVLFIYSIHWLIYKCEDSIINDYWTRWWQISKFIPLRQAISDEGFPELNITWRDWINLISVIAESSPPPSPTVLLWWKNKYPFLDHRIKKLGEWTISSWIVIVRLAVLWNVRPFLAMQWLQKDLQKQTICQAFAKRAIFSLSSISLIHCATSFCVNSNAMRRRNH